MCASAAPSVTTKIGFAGEIFQRSVANHVAQLPLGTFPIYYLQHFFVQTETREGREWREAFHQWTFLVDRCHYRRCCIAMGAGMWPPIAHTIKEAGGD